MTCMVVLIWIGLAALVGKYHHDRGHTFAGGFFASIMCSPVLGFIFSALSAPSKEGIEAHQLEDGESKKCPACAEIIKAEAKKCRFCGTDL